MMFCAMLRLVLPAIVGALSGKVHNVRDYGAVGDGVTYDTDAVRAAAAALEAGGGGTILFPSGTYLTGAFNISSDARVEITPNATLLGSTRGEDWPLVVARTVWPQMGHGSDCRPGSEECRLMHQALVFVWGSSKVSVGGGGKIDCNSQKDTWWHCARNLTLPPCSGYSRPHCIMMANATDVEVGHIHVANSPDWTLHFSNCSRVHAHDLVVINPLEPNGDGIDIDSSQDVLVENNYFSVGDDALCVKSGIDFFGRQFGRPTRNVLFRNNDIGSGHGITIGSEMSGGVENVTFENITMRKTGRGIRLKAMRGRGGTVKGIVYRDINMVDIEGECVSMTLNYGKAPPTNASATPLFDGVLIENVICRKGSSSFFLDGLPEQHMRNVIFRNVTINQNVGKESACRYIDCVCENSRSCPSCCRGEVLVV
eukprot:TRINITY_DN29417_c0_g1_i1.p1 TRINITY_DN29417_c0_g1~~TRINITY_DN29417_c0_g1_i1.p1  ORF type:complete len:426 (-),score=49.19 TRINITY_DN29417_c0_g1_i1:89-1366(-)